MSAWEFVVRVLVGRDAGARVGQVRTGPGSGEFSLANRGCRGEFRVLPIFGRVPWGARPLLRPAPSF